MTTSTSQLPDRVYRAMTDDGSFRVVTLRATQTVAGVLKSQRVDPATARHLGDLVIGSVLIRETMSPALRVQGLLKREGRAGYLLGDSHPSGRARGLAAIQRESGPFEMQGAVLQMMRTLQDGRVQQGVVAVPDGADVSRALMTYMQESEQITTMIVVCTQLNGDEVTAAGGYLLQLLPKAERGPLAVMAERLDDFRDIDKLVASTDFTPGALCSELLWGMPYTPLEESEFAYGCWCSRTSMLGAVASLGRGDIQEMVDAGEVLDIQCDYCGENYRLPPNELVGLLDDN